MKKNLIYISIIIIYTINSVCNANIIITSTLGGSLAIPENIQFKLSKNQESGKSEKIKEVTSYDLEKLLLYIKNAQEKCSEEKNWREIIEELSENDHATNPHDLCTLINVTVFLNQRYIAHALAKRYIKLYAASKEMILTPELPFLQESKILLRKIYFLLTNDPGALYIHDEHGNPSVITLTLEEVFLNRRIYIENSKLDLSNLFLGSLDGITLWLKYPQAQQLDISNNQLESLPAEISVGTYLKSINAAHNLFEHIPDVVCTLPELEKLDVSYNKLKTFPKHIGNLKKLMRINAKHNALIGLPESIQQCSSLRWLDLNENPLEQVPENLRSIVRGYNK